MKKLLIGAASAALFLASVAPAFASNNASIKYNDVTVSADTGGNNQSSGDVKAWNGSGATGGDQTLVTGDAKAKGKQIIVANVTLGCGCDGDPSPSNTAKVEHNDLTVSADTGDNHQTSGKVKAWNGSGATGGSQLMVTGDAKAKGKQLIVVNVSAGFPW